MEESWEMLNWMVKYVEENEENWKNEGEDLLEMEKKNLEEWKKLSTPEKIKNIEESQTERIRNFSEKSTKKDLLTTPKNVKSTEEKKTTTPLSLTPPNPRPPQIGLNCPLNLMISATQGTSLLNHPRTSPKM